MAQKLAHGQDRCRVSKVFLKIFVFALVRLLYPNTAMRGKKNFLSIFDRVQFQGEEEFERHTRSLRDTLVA